MKIKIVHRADGRTLNDSTIKRDKGFACQNGAWATGKNTVTNARAFVAKLLDPNYDVSKLKGFELAAEILKPVKSNFKNKEGKQLMTTPGLKDVVASIKRILKDTRAFWISTSLNEECGGYNDGKNNVYQFTLPKELRQYVVVKDENGTRLEKIKDRTDALQPSICMDGDATDGSDSNIIAINSGPLNDVEISFLTSLPLAWTKQIAP